jgi:hypothetical protein
MTAIGKLFYFFTISLFFCSCASNNTKNKDSEEMVQPAFADNGKAIDSLKQVYNCESINYEHWENKKATDSCLTVCLINSAKVPARDNADDSANQLKAIASAIKKSLAKPDNYKSFYIIFVKKDSALGQEIKVHSDGMEIKSAEL